MMVYPRSSQDALDPKRRLGPYQPRPCARPDDIATYLFLDEALVARLQRNRPASCDFSDRSKWIPQVRGFVDDIVNASGVRSTQRLFLFAATVTFVFVVASLAWYWQTTVRFMESTDDAYVGGEVTTLSAKVAGFIQTVTVADNQSVEAGGSRLPCAARPRRGERCSAAVSSRQYRRQPAHAQGGNRTGVGRGCRRGRRTGPRQI